MRPRLKLVLATLLVATLVGHDWPAVAGPPRLVFEGTVTAIRTVANERKPWLVTVNVTKVISGAFSGSTFELVVHSPVLAGLKKGRSYTIEADWNGDGYVVDEGQWRRPTRFRAETRSAVPAIGLAVRKGHRPCC
jgi:hypothetical protein